MPEFSLDQLLATRIMGTQGGLVRPPAHYPVQGPVRDAVGVLKGIGLDDTPTVQLVNPPQDRARRAALIEGFPQNNAFVRDAGRNDPNIYVNTWTPEYRKAASGDPAAIRELAAILAHESHHAQGHEDEAGAYDRQLRVLTQLGASPDTLAKVSKARTYAIRMTAETGK